MTPQSSYHATTCGGEGGKGKNYSASVSDFSSCQNWSWKLGGFGVEL